MLELFEDGFFNSEIEECYDEIHTENGTRFAFDCGHETTVTDHEAIERITADNTCPDCGFTTTPPVPLVSLSDTKGPDAPISIIKVEGDKGLLTIDLATGNIDADDEVIREALTQIVGCDDLHDPAQARLIIWDAYKAAFNQTRLF